MNSGVYEILNTANGKRYVGSAVDFGQRWNEHRSKLRRGKHHSKPLQNAWLKYSESVFTFSPLVICASADLLVYEQIALDTLTPRYNVCRVAGNTFGRTHSPETRAKIAAKATGRVRQPRSVEHRANISAAHKGKKKSPEHIAALQAGRKNRVYTDEQKKAIGDALRKAYASGLRSREKSDQHRKSMSKAFSKLSAEAAREIKRLRTNGVSCSAIASQFMTTASTVSQIARGLRYRWVAD